MALWLELILGVLALVFCGIVLAVKIGSYRLKSKTAQLVTRVVSTQSSPVQKIVTFKELEGLPAPVERYFRFALKEGQPPVRLTRIVQTGEFRSAGDKWNRFTATQHFSANPPGFVWDASIHMSPLVNVHVRDAYVAGQGMMQAKILSLVTLVDASGTPELASGALQRFLAEAVWFPTALLPGSGVKWTAIDGNRASATLTYSGTTVSLEVLFGASGEIISVFTPARYREVHGKYIPTSWEGHFRNYQEKGGMQIPLDGEVEWYLPGGKFSYWKGRIVGVEYGFM